MSIFPDTNLKWRNIYDGKNYVGGIAYVKKGFKAEIHSHKEVEDYYFLYGTGKLYLDGEIRIVNSPKVIRIESNIKHAMTPISEYVVLFYSFNKGPFKSIKYKYFDSKI